MLSELYQELTFVGLSSAALCSLVIALNLRKKNQVFEQHWIHSDNAPRVGGILIIFVFFIASMTLFDNDISRGLIYSAIPIMLVGSLDDHFLTVSPLNRLFAAMLASAFGIVIFDTRITELDVYILDDVLGISVASWLITIFLTSSFCHTYNIVDGLNGLCSGVAIISIISLLLIHEDTENPDLVICMFILLFSLGGFWLVNFFTGQIFLGDAGALFLGHSIAWMSVLMVNQTDNISPWYFVLISIYPVTETCLTIVRRAMTKSNLLQPDRKHLHHLVHFLMLPRFGGNGNLSNPASALLLLSFSVVAGLAGYPVRHSGSLCFLLCLVFGGFFLLIYFTLRRSLHA